MAGLDPAIHEFSNGPNSSYDRSRSGMIPMGGVEKLPDARLQIDGSIGTELCRLGFIRFRDFASYVQKLPYGRTSDPSRFLLVLSEGRGTCSSKHALIAAAAQECSLGIQLWLGFYEMAEANTPGVGPVLSSYGLESILEAHCYLKFDGQCIDLTGLGTGDISLRMISEQRIEPQQIGPNKAGLHREQMDRWRTAKKLGFSPQELWEIREACIRALSK